MTARESTQRGAVRGVVGFWSRHWAAFFRIYIGSAWLAYGTSKFRPKWYDPNGQFYQATKATVGELHDPVHRALAAFVLGHQHTFALLIACGESLVGISLVLGLLTQAGAAGGMFLAGTYYLALAGYRDRLGIESLELLLFACCAVLLTVRAGDTFSIDALLFKKRARA